MQGSGGCISRSFAEPAVHALAEMRQQLQSSSLDECCKLREDIETVLQLLKETSVAIEDDDEGECASPEGLDQVQPESSVEFEEI
jgi:hypothetical protein